MKQIINYKSFINLVLLALVGCAPFDPNSRLSSSDLPANRSQDNECFDEEGFVNTACLPAVELEQIQCVGEHHSTDYAYEVPFSNDGFPTFLNPDQYIPPHRLVDLEKVEPNLQISKNFVLSEFMSAQKGRYGILADTLLRAMQDIRTTFGRPIRINSGYRGPAYNAQISNASRWSRHMYGDAADFRATNRDIPLESLALRCRELNAGFVQVYVSHVHCDWRTSPLPEFFFGIPMPPSIGLASFNIDVDILTEKNNVAVNETLELKAHMTPREDEGELLVKWNVMTPSNNEHNYQGEIINLIFSEPGQYIIDANIGGGYMARKVIQVD